MQRLIAVRLFQGLVTLFIVSMVIFLLSRATGSPLDLMLPPDATPDDRAQMAQTLGLDRSYPEQYLGFLSHAVRADLGRSVRSGEPVTKLYMQRLPNTLKLALSSILFVLLVGGSLGILAALKKGTPIDWIARLVMTLGIAIPLFWFGLVLMQIFSVGLRVLPTGGMGGPKYFVLPAVTLGFALTAGVARLLRGGMLDALETEHVKMLRVKGLPEWKVIFQHSLRNAAIAPITFLGQYTAIILGGAVVVEVIFAWPGIGMLAYDAIVFRDFPVIQGVMLINAAILILASLLVDVLYMYVDPRMKVTV